MFFSLMAFIGGFWIGILFHIWLGWEGLIISIPVSMLWGMFMGWLHLRNE